MPDTDEALQRIELIERLIFVARKVKNRVYQNITVIDKDGKATGRVDRCLCCKRYSIGPGVLHRPDCPVRPFTQILAQLRELDKADAEIPEPETADALVNEIK